MTLPASGTITLAQVQSEFGGADPISMSEYYRNGAYVTSNNTNVPTSGTISMSNFYGGTKIVGLTWTNAAALPWTNGGFCGAYGNGRYVVGSNTNSYVIYSTDGSNWTLSTGLYTAWGSQTSYAVNSIRYLNGQFVAVGGGGKVATSSDGVTWTNQSGLSSSAWGSAGPVYDIAWSGSYYMVVGGASSASRAVSTNLSSWTNLGFVGSLGALRTVAYGNGRFVVGSNGGGLVGYSTDNGANWTTQLLSGWNAGSAGAVRSIVYNGSMFVALSYGAYFSTSTDGITWTNRSSTWTAASGAGTSAYPQAAAWTGTNWVFANSNSSKPIIVSADGTAFTSVAVSWSGSLLTSGVVLSNGSGQAVAVSNSTGTFAKAVKSP